MKILKHFFIPIIIIFVYSVPAGRANATHIPSNDRLLEYLDSLILIRDNLEAKRQYVVSEYQRKLRTATTPEQRYRVNNMLYDIYANYNIDSAMTYIDHNMAIARQLNNPNLIAELKIKKSFLYAASGLLKESGDEIADIEGGELEPETRRQYYAQMAYLFDHMANYLRINPIGANRYFDSSNDYKDSLLTILTPDDHEYLWYKGWSMLGYTGDKVTEIINTIKEAVDNSTLSTSDDAKNAYVLGCLYLKRGEKELGMRYVAMSAIVDVQLCNRDIASLQKLAMMCLEDEQIDRAHSYIGYCFDAALKYPNRVRASTIAPLQHKINAAYQERSQQQERTRRMYLMLVSILSIGLFITIVVIIREMYQLKHKQRQVDEINKELNSHVVELSDTKAQLTEANEKLKSLNTQLKSANTSLNESNYVKEEYVGYVFSLCSMCIKQMDDFRLMINRKAKMKQWDDIKTLTDGKNMEKDMLREFYNNFDTIFLHLYPHFVSDFNALLQPDKQIIPKEGELLTTELRIYALVRLGITDSVKIADFLHCSPQTVYNYRFRIRNNANMSKNEFLEAVKTLGQIVIE